MSIHWDEMGNRHVIRFRDGAGCNRAVTVNCKNLTRYGLHIPDRITERVAKRLEEAVLARELMADGSFRSVEKRQLLWLDVVARYLPPLLDGTGRDTWQNRPSNQRLENERTYSRDQLDRMQRILTLYFPSYLDHRRITWERKGKRKHNRAGKVFACTRRISSVTREDVAGFQIYLTNEVSLSPASVRGYMAALKTFLVWCNKREYILTNPAVDVKSPSGKRQEVRWLHSTTILITTIKLTP